MVNCKGILFMIKDIGGNNEPHGPDEMIEELDILDEAVEDIPDKSTP